MEEGAGPDDGLPILPPHIHQTVGAVARVHVAHLRAASRGQRAIARIVAAVGQPLCVLLLTALVLSWTTGNLLAGRAAAIDPPPFALLEAALSLAALALVVLILTTQRHDDRLERLREQLVLELFILNEQKSAKIIGMLEEMRSHNSLLPDRMDAAARAMSTSVDPASMLAGVGADRLASRPAMEPRP